MNELKNNASEEIENRKIIRRVKKRKKTERRFRSVTRILALVYLLMLLVFEIAIVVVDIIPAGQMILFTVVLGIFSAIIFAQLSCKKVARWARITATVAATCLIIFYGIGTSYAFSTFSFLNKVSNDKNKKSVQVTRKPFNILVSGMDTYVASKGGRSDVNMIITVNPKTRKIHLTSIPRDYEIRLMEYDKMTDKLTHAGFYGIKHSISSVEDLLGIDINYYFKINFSTIIRFVDMIGGVDVRSEYDFDGKYGGDGMDYEFHKGINHLNGRQALAFARERHSFQKGDNQRVINQQKVVQAMLNKAFKGKTIITKYDDILSDMGDDFEMNMSSSEVRALVKMQLADGKKWKISKYTLKGFDSHQATYSSGNCYVMAQDPKSVKIAYEKIMKITDPDWKPKKENNKKDTKK